MHIDKSTYIGKIQLWTIPREYIKILSMNQEQKPERVFIGDEEGNLTIKEAEKTVADVQKTAQKLLSDLEKVQELLKNIPRRD